MSYFDGVVAAVPVANKGAFIENAEKWADVFLKYGALEVVETWGDSVPDGEVTSFPMAVQKKADEVVAFSWIKWPSQAARDSAWDRMIADEVMADSGLDLPYDGKRMIFGKFESVVERSAAPGGGNR